MFSLIISIIAIALVAAIALASIYYGGEAFQTGTVDAAASTVVNQGQQVQAAVQMASLDKSVTISTAKDLVDSNFLKEIPKFDGNSWVLDLSNGVAKVVVSSVEICDEIIDKNDTSASIGTAAGKETFGCYSDDGGTTYTAYYTL